LKVAFCLRNFLPQHAGGTEVYVAALCGGLQRLGVETFIIKPGFNRTEVTEYFYNELRIIEYPEPSAATKDIIQGKEAPAGLAFFGQVMVKEKPDVIHFHDITGSNGITTRHLAICKNLRIPIFTTLHLAGYVCKTGTLKYKGKVSCDGLIDTYKCSVCTLHEKGLRAGLPEILTGLGMIAEKWQGAFKVLPGNVRSGLSYPEYIRRHKAVLETIFSNSEKVFVLSNWFKAVLLKNQLPENKMILLEKALPHSQIPVMKRISSVESDDKQLRFVYLGRISWIKGLHVILEALAGMKNKNWSLDIYGQVLEEPYFEKCKALAAKVSGNVTWKGILSPAAVLETLSRYDALIFPTIIEEMVGLVVMEAFAAKIPVIGSAVKGIAEQVEDGKTGILFEAGNAKELKNILERVTTTPSILTNLAGNIRLPGNFGDVACHSLKIYESVLMEKTVNLT